MDQVDYDKLLANATERRDSLVEGQDTSVYDSILQKKDEEQNQKIMNSLFSVGGINPDQAAEAQKLGLDLGVGPDVARRNMDDLRKRAALMKAQEYKLTASSPVLARQLTDPEFAAIAQDDLEQLTGTEKTMQVMKNLGSTVPAALSGLSSGVIGLGRAQVDLYGQALDVGYRALGYDDKGENPAEMAGNWLGRYQTRQREIAAYYGTPEGKPGVVERGVYSGVTSALRNIITAPLLFGGPAGATAYLGLNVGAVGGDEYGKAREQGLDPLRATIYGGGQAAVEYATEKMPLIKLLEDLGGNAGLLKTVGRQIASEVPREQAATIVQDLNEWAVLNPDKPFSSYIEERPSAFAETLIATVIATGGQTTLIKGAEAVFNHIDRAGADAWRATLMADNLKRLTESATASKLRQRNPAAYQKYVATQTEGTPIENLYIDAEQMVEVLNQSNLTNGELDAMLPGLREQLTAAVLPGGNVAGDIVIPTAQYAAAVAGTDLGNAMMPHVRMGEQAMSQTEAEQFEGQKQQMIAEAAQVMDQKRETDKVFIDSASEVQKTLYEQLVATGVYTKEQSKNAAVLQSATYITLASQMGLTPSQVYELMPYKQQAGQGMNTRPSSVQTAAAPAAAATAPQTPTWSNYGELLRKPANSHHTFLGDFGFSFEANNKGRYLWLTSEKGQNLFQSKDGGDVDATTTHVWSFKDPNEGNTREGPKVGVESLENNVPPDLVPVFRDYLDGKIDGDEAVARIRETQRAVSDTQTSNLGQGAISNVIQRIRGVITAARGKGHAPEKAEIAPVAPWLVEAAKESGIDIEGYTHTVDGSAVRHALKEHGDAKAETRRGQVGLTDADFEAIPSVISNPDAVVFGAVSRLGKPMIGYIKNMPDGSTLYVEEVRTGKRDLAMLSMWKYPGAKDFSSIGTLLSNARSDTGDSIRVVTPPPDVNPDMLRQTATVRRGEETLKAFGLDPGKKYNTRDVAAALETRQRETYGKIAEGDYSDDASGKIANWMLEEVLFEVEEASKNPAKSAVGWYSTKFQRALDALGAAFPEFTGDMGDGSLPGVAILKTKESARAFFTAMMAITSDGAKVADNFRFAAQSYEHFRQTGRVNADVTFGGERNISMRINLANIQETLDAVGPDGMAAHLLKKDTISNLKKIAKQNGREFSSAYKASMELPYAALIFGPKLGAFYANLMGDTGYLTMDRWWSRTFNRYRGTLLQAPTQAGLKRFKELVTADRKLNEPPEQMTDDAALALTVDYVKSYKAKGYKSGTEIEKAANTLYKAAFEGLEDQPFNASDREFMVNTTLKAQKLLEEKGVQLTVADIQAVLWYYEKRLYGQLGARQTQDISYEEIARKVVEGRSDPAGRSDDEVAGAAGDEAVLDPGSAGPGSGDVAEDAVDEEFGLDTLNQGPRGGYSPQQLTTILNESSDVSTVMHEFSHFYLDVLTRLISHPSATPQMKADLQAMVEFGGATMDQWTAWTVEYEATGKIPEGMRKVHEAVAYNTEIYLFEGKAPSLELQGAFERFVRWMKQVYINIRDQLNAAYRQEFGEDLPVLTGEVRQVFDRMLASGEEIKQAQAVRNMMPVFGSQAESGMSPEEWTAYQAMLEEARDAAVTDLTKASLRQMQWLSNARGRLLKEMQRKHEARRKEIRKEVSEEIAKRPLYQAIEFLKRGKIDGVEVEYPVKLSIEEIEAMYGENPIVGLIKKSLGFGKFGMLASENAIHPDQVAEMFGFKSGDAMVRELLAAPSLREAVNTETDARMLAENGDLNTPEAKEAAIEAALHNEARARFVAVELRFLEKATQPVRVMLKAAQQIARETIARKVIKEIRPREYSVAEGRAAKKAIDAMKAGDSKGAARAKQAQLLQNQLAAEAIAAREEIKAALTSFRNLFKADNKIAKGRNIDLVNAARAILAAYGIGKADKPPVEYTQQLRAYNPELYAELEPLITKHAGKPYEQLTLDQFRLMRDTVDALWYQARRDNQVMVEGRKMSLETVVGELNTRLTEIGIPPEVPGEREAVGTKERMVQTLFQNKALIRRVEHWTSSTDGPNGPGPFTKYIWRPMRKAIDAYRAERNVYVKRYVELLQKVNMPVGKIAAPELGYTFGNANGGIGKAEVLGALMHTGNESNFRKLLLGRGWARELGDGTIDTTRWDAFRLRMISEGVITKDDMDFVQAVWDLNEELKPQAQKAHHDMFGYYFKEIDATPVTTPWGVYRGGYVPAKTDPNMVRDAQVHQKMEELESDFRNSMPSTGMGFTKGRVEYNKPLSLDVRMIAKHIDDVIRFAHVQPVVKDVLRILRQREFADNLTRIDPAVVEGMLLPWLNRAARQITSEAGKSKAVDNFFSKLRTRSGIAIMFFNITNAAQQLTGYFPALLKVKPSYLKSALVQYMGSPQATTEEISKLSLFMADRLKNQMFDIQDTMNDLLLNPTRYDKIQKWAAQHGYFLQQAFQNQVDVVTWTGAFNQTLAELGADNTDAEAVREAVDRADAAVRMTQSSLAPEDISKFEVGTPLVKLMIQFSGYFNMMANLNADEYVKIFRDLGWRGNKGKLFMTYLLGFALPVLVSQAIVQALGGGWDDEDDDGYMDEFMSWFFGSQLRGAVALVPGAGPSINAFLNAFDDKPYNDRFSLSPAISLLEGAAFGTQQMISNVITPDKEVTGKNVRDVLTLISLVTGIPVTVLGRPIGYQIDVSRDKIEPTSTADYLRGLATGKASEASRP